MADDLMTLPELAKHLRIGVRSLQMLLPNHPHVVPMRIGKRLLFSPMAVRRLEKAIECPFISGSGVKSTTRAARSGSAPKSSTSHLSAQERVAAALQRRSPPPEKRRSAKGSLTVLQGGLEG